MSQIRLHKSKQKPFVVCCGEGIVPRSGEKRFQSFVKLSACQISGFRGERFVKLHRQGAVNTKVPRGEIGLQYACQLIKNL